MALAWAVIIAASLYVILRFAVPVFGEYHHHFENFASQIIARPVKFARVEAHWQGLQPTFGFKRVVIMQKDVKEPLIEIHKIRIGIDLWASLCHQKFIPGKITLSGLDLSMSQQPDGTVKIKGISTADSDGPILRETILDNKRFTEWLASQPRLQLNHINIYWHSRTGEVLRLQNLKLNLVTIQDQHYRLNGQVLLKRFSSYPLVFSLDVTGNLTVNQEWTAKGKLQGQAVQFKMLADRLPLSFMRLKEGKGDVALQFHGNQEQWLLDHLKLNIQSPRIDIIGLAKLKHARLYYPASSRNSHLMLNCGVQAKETDCNLSAKDLLLDFDDWFRQALPLQTLKTHLNWISKTDYWRFTASDLNLVNKDFKLRGELGLKWPQAGNPELNVLASYQLLANAAIANYVPLKYVTNRVVDWVATGVHNGKTADGEVVLRGPILQFPFDHQEGVFETTTKIHQAQLHYQQGWPALEKVSGVLSVRGRKVDFHGDGSHCYHVKLDSFDATIPHLSKKDPIVVNATGSLHGDLHNVQQFIKQSPLQAYFGEALNAMEWKGPMDLDLQLQVPVANSQAKPIVNGQANVQAGTFKYLQPKIQLNRLRGKLKFTNDQLQADNWVGVLWQEPVTLQFGTLLTNEKPAFTAQLRGHVSSKVAKEYYGMDVYPFVQGRTQYQASLHIPLRQTEQAATLNVQSNLYGIKVDLSPVFQKTESTTTPLDLTVKVQRQQPTLLLAKVGDAFSTTMQLNYQGKRLQIPKVKLKLGSGLPPALLNQSGVEVSGRLATLDQKLLDLLRGDVVNLAHRNPINTYVCDHLKMIHVTIGTLALYGQSFKDVVLSAQPSKEYWSIGINSSAISGQLEVPKHFPNKGVLKARMKRMAISEGNFGAAVKNIKPMDIGNLDVDAYNTYYGDKFLGRITFQTFATSNSLAIKNIQAGDRGWEFNGNANWEHHQSNKKTFFKGQIAAHDVAKMLHDWNYPASVKGKGKMSVELNWPGAPYELHPKQLNGLLHFNMDKGQLSHIDPNTQAKIGMGQLINLLSTANLQRVVHFDFRGLLGKALSFDKITGTFTIVNGNARTKNLVLRGAVANVDMKGRIDLVNQDLSLRLGVEPHVTGSLPAVATVAGGPMAGAATWLVEKITSPLVGKMTRTHYQVTGTWDNPIIKKL